MAPTALALGLKPHDDEFPGMPVRVRIHDVSLADHMLPDDVIYIGHGSFLTQAWSH